MIKKQQFCGLWFNYHGKCVSHFRKPTCKIQRGRWSAIQFVLLCEIENLFCFCNDTGITVTLLLRIKYCYYSSRLNAIKIDSHWNNYFKKI